MVKQEGAERTLLEDIAHWGEVQPDKPFLIEHWTTHHLEITWGETANCVRNASAWLANKIAEGGGGPGSRIGLLSRNRAHWILADLAILASGCVCVPMFPTVKADMIEYASSFAEIDLLLVGPAENWEAVKHVFPEDLPRVRLPFAQQVPGAFEWDDIVAEGENLPPPAPPDPNSLATIVFTSGTTGVPKGVMHSLNSLREAGFGCTLEIADAGPHLRYFSYLPLAHLGERIVVEMTCVVIGGSVHFGEDLNTFVNDLQYAKPIIFLGVPRIWEKLQQAVLAFVIKPEEIQRARVAGDMATVQCKVQDFLGMREAKYILTSTAPTPAPLKEWYEEMGIILYEGYGQSEILPITGTKEGDRKIGTVGVAATGVELRIADNGEIMARARGTALGYYKQPELTAKTFDADGWVHTGDKGFLDEDNHLHITGRVKEIFKTAKGKYVAPAPIEGKFLATSLAEQACLTGHGLAQTVMIAVLTEAAAAVAPEQVHQNLLQHVTSINDTLEKHERIGGLIISRETWTPENGVLTHTLKIKRNQVEDRFAEQIDEAGERMRVGEPLFIIDVALDS